MRSQKDSEVEQEQTETMEMKEREGYGKKMDGKNMKTAAPPLPCGALYDMLGFRR